MGFNEFLSIQKVLTKLSHQNVRFVINCITTLLLEIEQFTIFSSLLELYNTNLT